jgi:hypothetical protein
MTRRKPTINTVDLTRALKAMQTAGITIISTTVRPDGEFTIQHILRPEDNSAVSPEGALFKWESNRGIN